ncbi:hypothetical protein [Streptomyces phaeochromogenes]
MAVQPEQIPTAPVDEPEAHPRLSLVKKPTAVDLVDEEPAPVDDEHQDHGPDEGDGDEYAAPVGGPLAEIGVLVGRNAWTEFARETGTLIRDIAAHFAGAPSRAVRATWRATVAVIVRIKDGSVILGGRIVEWLTVEETKPKPKKTKRKGKQREDAKSSADEVSEWPTPVRRGGLLLVIAGGVWHEGKDNPITVAAVAVTAWSAAALIASWYRDEDCEPTELAGEQSKEPESAPQDDHEKSEEAGEKPTFEQATARLARYVEHAVAAAHHMHKHKGVHTETLLDGINRTEGLRAVLLDPLDPQGKDWDVPRLNAAFAEIGIPVHSKGFKLIIDGRQRVRAGVRYDQLEKHLGRRPVLPPSLAVDHTPVHTPD